MQLNTQVMEQHYHNQEQIQQNNQISEQQLQLEQLNIIIDVLTMDRNGKVHTCSIANILYTNWCIYEEFCNLVSLQ